MTQIALVKEPPERTEPPSRPCPRRSTTFLVGRNSRGIWVVQDTRGDCGGLFVDRTEALKFALFENGNRPQAVIMVPGTLELDLRPKAAPRVPPAVSHDSRRAA